MKIKVNSDDDIPLKKALELHNMIVDFQIDLLFMTITSTICKFFWIKFV